MFALWHDILNAKPPYNPRPLQNILKPHCQRLLAKYADSCDFEVVMCILQNIDDKNPRLYNSRIKNHEDMTILHWAAKYGQKSIIEYVCRFVDERNPHDRWGTTPLHLAAESGYCDIVQFLMQFRSTESLPKSYGVNTPLDMAARSGNLETFKYLITFADYKDLRANNGKI